MLIAQLTKRGAARVLDGTTGQALPIHHAFKRTDGAWVLCVADFRYPGGFLPFQPWTLSEGDYALMEATYDGGGWSYVPAPFERLMLAEQASGEYLARFPLGHQTTAERAYTDGAADALDTVPEMIESAFRAGWGYRDGDFISASGDRDVDWDTYRKENSL